MLDFGIGAKTNVGYGQFTDEIPKKVNTGSKQVQGTSINDTLTQPAPEILRLLTKDSQFEGTIIAEKKDNRIIEFEVNGEKIRIKKKAEKIKNCNDPKIGTSIIITFLKDVIDISNCDFIAECP